MKSATIPVNEQERLAALDEYDILDSLPEADFDDITRIASEICHTPISLVTIIHANRQWFKSRHGFPWSEIHRDISFCAHAMHAPEEVFIVPDAAKDDRFHDNPLVTGEADISFYAGIPLINPEGFVLGTLCVFDTKPNDLTPGQVGTLRSLARQIVCQLELRKKVLQLNETQAELKNAYADLEKFSYIASHDLKSPLNNIISLTHLLKDGYSSKLDEEGNEYINFLNDAAYQLSDLVTGILSYSRSSQMLLEHLEQINLTELIGEVIGLLSVPANTTITYDKSTKEIYTSRIALKQILLNLLHNAIKYIDKPSRKIKIVCTEEPSAYIFEVRDNGPGIAEENQEKVFELFERLQKKSQNGESLGIGLAIVKRLVEKLGGTIKIVSEMTKGTSFIFTIPR